MPVLNVPRPKILIVEDEQIVAADLELDLIQLGYDVAGVAARGDDAIRLTEDQCPDLVVMDIQLQGGTDGIAAAAEIRRRWGIPTIFLTANTNASVLEKAKAVAPMGYIAKPFSRTELGAMVAVALQQHRTVRELFRENNWLTTLFASLSDGVIATDLDASVRFMNPVAERITGWTLREAQGKKIEDVYPLLTPEGLPVELCQLRRALATRAPAARERYLLVSRSGRRFFVEDGAAPITNAKGEMTGAATTFIDITDRMMVEQERERLLAELARSNQDLTRFSYAVSHDLQAPLRTIRSMTEFLAQRPEGRGEKEQTMLTMVTQAAGGMQRLIESLLKYAQAGQGQIHRESVPLGAVIDTAELALGTLIAETHAQIVRGPLPVVRADRTQLEQLIQNLISNAIQYRRRDQVPVIRISGIQTEDGWELSVADNGEGVPAEAREQIFEPLKRLHGNEVPGSGLGLALCRTIVQRHDGSIWVEPATGGYGSTFRVVRRDV